MAKPSGAQQQQSRWRRIGGGLRRRWKRVVVLVLGGLIGLSTLAYFVVLPALAQHLLLQSGATAPALHLTDLGGVSVDAVAESHKRPVAVIFFAADCSDCRTAGPGMCQLAADHRNDLVLAVDAYGHQALDVTSFKSGIPGNCDRLDFFADSGETAAHAYGILEVPTVYIIRDGRISGAFRGNDSIAQAGVALTAAG